MRKIFAVPVTDKGGAGKSFVAQIIRETLRGPEALASVQVIDSDVGNSSMVQIDPKARYAGLRDANDIAAQGVISRAMKDLADGAVDGVVWDTAAGIENIVRDVVLPSLIARAKKAKITLVCFRLVTTSQYTQDKALDFAQWARENRVAVVFVRNLGQGRAARYFREWEELEDRRAAMPPAVEVVLPDLGCWVADEAQSLGLGLADVAVGDFSRLAGRSLEVAQAKFTEDVRLAVADYLEVRCREFQDAIEAAVANLEEAEQ